MKFLEENQHKRSIGDDVMLLRQLDPFVGDLMLKQVHMGSLQGFIAKRRSDGVKTRSINNALALGRHILNLSAAEWRDEQGMTWLEHAPKIKLFPVRDGRPPYPLAREEQAMLFQELPDHLARMARHGKVPECVLRTSGSSRPEHPRRTDFRRCACTI